MASPNPIAAILNQSEMNIALIKKQLNDKKFQENKDFNDEMFALIVSAEIMLNLVKQNNILLEKENKEDEQRRELAKEIAAKQQEELTLSLTQEEFKELENLTASLSLTVNELLQVIEEFNEIIGKLDNKIQEMTTQYETVHNDLRQTISDHVDSSIEFTPLGASQSITLDLAKDEIVNMVHSALSQQMNKGTVDHQSIVQECNQAIQNDSIFTSLKKRLQDQCPAIAPGDLDRNAVALSHKIVAQIFGNHPDIQNTKVKDNIEKGMEIRTKKQALETEKDLMVVHVKMAQDHSENINKQLSANGRVSNDAVSKLSQTVENLKKGLEQAKQNENSFKLEKEAYKSPTPRPPGFRN
ncbi:MAG: hypothetical protein JO131_04590 [Gammaproteobacteria bacterium]|nr:hypothetical protein [Gammaproteobacteria bacterium]